MLKKFLPSTDFTARFYDSRNEKNGQSETLWDQKMIFIQRIFYVIRSFFVTIFIVFDLFKEKKLFWIFKKGNHKNFSLVHEQRSKLKNKWL